MKTSAKVRFLSSLVVADHANGKLNPITLNVISAASKLGGDVHTIVIGDDCKSVADEVSKVKGVKVVHLAENSIFKVLFKVHYNYELISLFRASWLNPFRLF